MKKGFKYKDIITRKTFYGASDEEALKHDYGCYVTTSESGQRTIYTCNCSQREEYRKRFKENPNL